MDLNNKEDLAKVLKAEPHGEGRPESPASAGWAATCPASFACTIFFLRGTGEASYGTEISNSRGGGNRGRSRAKAEAEISSRGRHEAPLSPVQTAACRGRTLHAQPAP